jgi:hypothetical protein
VIDSVAVRLPLESATGLGLKDLLALFGKPLTVSVTLPLYPFTGLRVTVYVMLPGRFTVWLAGLTLSVKSGVGGTGVLVGTRVGGVVAVAIAVNVAVAVGGNGVLVAVGGRGVFVGVALALAGMVKVICRPSCTMFATLQAYCVER